MRALVSSQITDLTEGNTAAAISTFGTLTVSDVDSAATFQTQTDISGLYGKFSIVANGAWTYIATSAHDEFAAGVTYTDTFARAQQRRHRHLGHHPYPRHQRCRCGVRRHSQPDRDQCRRRHQHLRHADRQRHRQRGDVPAPDRHRRLVRHVLDRRQRRLDLHRHRRTQRVRRRRHLYRQLRRAQQRRHRHLGHHPHPRHQRCRRGVHRRPQPDRDQCRGRHQHLRAR